MVFMQLTRDLFSIAKFLFHLDQDQSQNLINPVAQIAASALSGLGQSPLKPLMLYYTPFNNKLNFMKNGSTMFCVILLTDRQTNKVKTLPSVELRSRM